MTPTAPVRFRIATYNLHKCRGFDLRIAPERIVSVMKELDADILCLQEVVNAPHDKPIYDQAQTIARAFPQFDWIFGANRPYQSGSYGNMTLSRFPIQSWRNHDITRPGREQRGILQTDVELADGSRLVLFNVHLGTGHMERRYQAGKLMNRGVLDQPDIDAPRLVLGDFNEWTRGLATRLLRSQFQTFRPHHAAKFPRTYPGMLPFLSLDHCYYEPPLYVANSRLWRSQKALFASDHLPLLVDFELHSAAMERSLAS